MDRVGEVSAGRRGGHHVEGRRASPLARRGVDRVIVFACVDCPEPAIEEVGRFGVEYAGSQVKLEELLGGQG